MKTTDVGQAHTRGVTHMKMGMKSKSDMSGARFKNLVGQLSRRPGPPHAGQGMVMAAAKGGGGSRRRPAAKKKKGGY